MFPDPRSLRFLPGAIIWGNHSSTQYPDINSATIKGVLTKLLCLCCVEGVLSNLSF